MEQAGDRVFIYHTDQAIDALLAVPAQWKPYSCHFSHNEEFFLRLAGDVVIPSLVIHHDVKIKTPDAVRRQAHLDVIRQIYSQAPGLLTGFHYFFDATDTMRLCFYQFMKVEEMAYLVLLRIDLGLRPAGATMLSMGSNDSTGSFMTKLLFLDMDIIPVGDVKQSDSGAVTMRIKQSVSETWIGETGRGYFVQGIWLDREITKFFSRLFFPPEKRLYPYFPVNCRFRAVCFQPFNFEPEGRRKAVSALHHCRRFLTPYVPAIEQALRDTAFSDDLPLFRELKSAVPPALPALFAPLSIRGYLNENDMKEYELCYETK